MTKFIIIFMITIITFTSLRIYSKEEIKKMSKEKIFLKGPSIDSPQLIEWLNNNFSDITKRKILRIPVLVIFEDKYRISIKDVFIVSSYQNIDKNKIRLKIDDSGMGISFIDRIKTICPENKLSCHVWIEGYWGPLLILDKDENKKENIFSPLKILRSIKNIESNKNIFYEK